MASNQLEITEQSDEALVTIPRQLPTLVRESTPEEQLEKAERICKLLKSYLDRKPRAVKFNGKRYPEADDWNFVANFFGHSTRTRWVRPIIEKEKIIGFEAAVDLLRDADQGIVGAGEAACMRDEPNWAKKPDFQLRSMAQTRAGAKACKGKFAWVMVMAGLAPTPAEEMTEENGNGSQGGVALADLPERMEFIANGRNREEVKKLWEEHFRAAKDAKDIEAMGKLTEAKNRRLRELEQ